MKVNNPSKSEKPLSIIFYTEASGGYGDLLFALKAVHGITKQYISTYQKNDLSIYLVAPEEDKATIQTLKGDVEFGVTVQSVAEYLNFAEETDFVADCYLLGPVFPNEFEIKETLKIPDDAKIIFIPEYSYYRDKIKYHPIIHSGFGKEEKGIFLTEELALADQKKQDYWKLLPPKIHAKILQSKTIEEYYATTELAYNYSNNQKARGFILYNYCEHFLRAHLLYCMDSPKNQDVISIGKNTHGKKTALEVLLPELKKAGFTKIEWVDLDAKESKCLYEDKLAEPKVYRQLICESLPHSEFTAVIAISNSEIAGVTGDQSFGEGFSAGKILVYECLAHKEFFASEFISALFRATKDFKVKTLAKLLLEQDLVTMGQSQQPPEIKVLRGLLKDRSILEKYKLGCKRLAEQYNLSTTISVSVPRLIFGNPRNTERMINFVEKVRILIPGTLREHLRILDTIISLQNDSQVQLTAQAALLGAILLLLTGIKNQSYFSSQDEKSCLVIFDEANKIFPNLSLDNSLLEVTCLKELKAFAEANPVLLHNQNFVRFFADKSEKIAMGLKLNLKLIKVGVSPRLDELIFADYQSYCEKVSLIGRSKEFFTQLVEFVELFPDKAIGLYACAGWLLLLRKSLSTKTDSLKKRTLLDIIESHLTFLQIHQKFEKFYINQLGIFCKANPELLQNKIFSEIFTKFSQSQLKDLSPKNNFDLARHSKYRESLLETFETNYECTLAHYIPSADNRPRQQQYVFLKSVIETALESKDPTSSYYAIIGALLLIRKHIRSESFLFHDNTLLPQVEKLLELSGIGLQADDKFYVSSLTQFAHRHPELIASHKILEQLCLSTIGSIKVNHPGELKAYQIKLYQKLAYKLKDDKSILKVSKKESKLQYSILKFPHDDGFYLLDSGADATLGVGGWGRVKSGYYCDKHGIVTSHPVAIKIEKENKLADSREIKMFATAHPCEAKHLYKLGARKNHGKRYSIFPKMPGIQLDKYLLANPALTLSERFDIAKAVAAALAKIQQNKVAHLDLKSKNILYNPLNKTAYIIDFGCALEFKTRFSSNDLGMSEYMPPEFFMPGNIINDKIDIYSCAVVISQILNIPLSKLMKDKLFSSIHLLYKSQAKDAVIAAFAKASAQNIFGETFYHLPFYVEGDTGFDAFMGKFSATATLNFDYLDQFSESFAVTDLYDLLTDMINLDPEARPTAGEVTARLTKIQQTVKNTTALEI